MSDAMTSPNQTKLDLNNDLTFQEKQQIKEYLKQLPLKTVDIDPKEYLEFYFIYKRDLEELWR